MERHEDLSIVDTYCQDVVFVGTPLDLVDVQHILKRQV